MLVNSVVGAMDGGMDEGRRVGWKATASALYLALCTSLSDGQKTNRSFEKKKGTGRRRRESTSRGENKHSPGRCSPPSPLWRVCRSADTITNLYEIAASSGDRMDLRRKGSLSPFAPFLPLRLFVEMTFQNFWIDGGELAKSESASSKIEERERE